VIEPSEPEAKISEEEILDTLGAFPVDPGPVCIGSAAGDASDGWEALSDETAEPRQATGSADVQEKEHLRRPKPEPAEPSAPATVPARSKPKVKPASRVAGVPAAPGQRSLGYAVFSAAVVLAVVGGLGAGAWSLLLFLSPVHAEARYLPARCDQFVSIRWPELAQSGLARVSTEMPGLMLSRRCRIFLRNAELAPQDVERINAGQAADRVDFLIVYRLARPVRPEEIMEKRPFRRAKYEREEVRGVPMYRHPTADSAVAFPEESVIINGNAELVRSALRRLRSGFRGPSSELLETLDFSAMSVVVTDGAPQDLLDAYLPADVRLTESIRGTVDRFDYGPTHHFLRELLADDEKTAAQLRQSLESSLTQAANAPKSPEPVRRMLASVDVSATEDRVRIELELEADQLSGESLEALDRLF
jgi:hypothetical protein